MMFKRLLTIIKGWFKKPQTKKRQKRKPIEEYGEFYFRRSILDQLSEYFKILATMKKADRDAYNLHSKIGAYILPNSEDAIVGRIDAVSKVFCSVMPSFGMVMFGDKGRSKDHIALSALYFQKYSKMHRPVRVQRPKANDASVYVCTAYFSEHRLPFEFGVAVTQDGGVEILKAKQPEHIYVRPKRGGHRFKITRHNWTYGEFAEEWADQHDAPVAQYLTELFCLLASCHQRASNGFVRVKAQKGALACVFNVNVLRTPYFFADRDTEVTQNGKKKRIFHIVRSHQRERKNGKTSLVKTHFRGIREFGWNGYRIRITVPGWHHANMGDFDGGVVDPEEFDGATVGSDEVGTRLVDMEDRGVGKHRRVKATSA